MFIGEYHHTIDEKGRMAVPAKFRKELTEGAIITKGLDNCLFIFTQLEWAVLAGKLSAMPLAKADARAFSRLMLAGAMEVEIDTQGRVLIPDYLRVYAGLKKEAVVVGVYSRLELWSDEAWSRYKAKTESSSDEIAEKLGELGI